MMPVAQRGDMDCGIAAIAAYADMTYEDVYIEAARVDARHRGKSGLFNREVIAIAARLGVTLTPTRGYDLESDEGVLRVRWNDPERHRGGHFIAIRDGKVACPASKRLRSIDEYLRSEHARPCTLLRRA